MDNFNFKKMVYTEKIADYILKNGIAESSLKKMAKAASTSDRMLMHYFTDKEEIMCLTLKYISQNFIEILDSYSESNLRFEELVYFIYNAIKDPQLRKYLNIWFELIHLASDEKEPYYSISKNIGESYWKWISNIYSPTNNEDKDTIASLVFTFTEGALLLDKMGMTDKIESALEALMLLYNSNSK